MRAAIMCDSSEQGAGSDTYTRNLVKYLYRLDPASIFPAHTKKSESIGEHDILLPSFPAVLGASLTRNSTILPGILKKQGINIVHYPTQGHFSALYAPGIKQVLTVFDTLTMSVPQYFPKSLIFLFKNVWPVLMKRVDKIVTISNATKHDIIKYYGIKEDKIVVVYPGVSEEFTPLPDAKKTDTGYGIRGPFILYVGTLEPRKNIPNLIRAFHKLKQAGDVHKLVICGKKGWMFEEIFRVVNDLSLQDDVVFTGYVPDKELVKLYNGADLFVYPSLFEGFGLPPLEAMACGVPVITSDTSSLPEVAGDAAMMVHPRNINELSKTMNLVLTDETLRSGMIRRGLARAKQFSWENTAKDTLKLYRELI